MKSNQNSTCCKIYLFIICTLQSFSVHCFIVVFITQEYFQWILIRKSFPIDRTVAFPGAYLDFYAFVTKQVPTREDFLLGPLVTLRTNHLLLIFLELVLQEFHLLVLSKLRITSALLIPRLLLLRFSSISFIFFLLLLQLRLDLKILLIIVLFLLRQLCDEVLAHFLLRFITIMLLNHSSLGVLYSFVFRL